MPNRTGRQFLGVVPILAATDRLVAPPAQPARTVSIEDPLLVDVPDRQRVSVAWTAVASHPVTDSSWTFDGTVAGVSGSHRSQSCTAGTNIVRSEEPTLKGTVTGSTGGETARLEFSVSDQAGRGGTARRPLFCECGF